MIPKIAHFHWDGPPMSPLRELGVESFRRLNPGWDVRLHKTPKAIRDRKLPTYANEADWTWLQMLHDHGGFALATDTIFVKPIPDEWTKRAMCACTNDSDVIYHNSFGSVSGTPFLRECLSECEAREINEDSDYQVLGALLLRHVSKRNTGHLRNNYDMPLSALCPVRFYQIPMLWARDGLELPDDTVGVTWFGGNGMSRERERDALRLDANSGIVTLAMEMGSDP